MGELAVIGIVLGVIALAVLAGRRAQQPDPATSLQRLHPGVADKAEWMASDTIIQTVITDYLLATDWLAKAQLISYPGCLRQLPRYYSGTRLVELERLVRLGMTRNRARFVGVMRATHRVTVRRFSEDGLSCLLIDDQTERRMATYDYWTKRRIHTQDLGDGAVVYRMTLDRSAGRWKIDDLIQQLPDGWAELPGSLVRLSDALPLAAGRDI